MKKSVALALAGAAMLANAAPAGAAPATDRVIRMGEVIGSDVDAGQFTGAVLVAEGDNILLDKGYGDANREWKQPNTGDTRFRLGSLTKQFTAVAILLLVEDGKLALDKPAASYVSGLPASWSAITVRQLLNHTSGLHDYVRLPDYGATKRLPATPDSLLARVKDMPLDFKPGEGWDYSNSGYVLLTKLIETASGQSYATFVQQRLFTPLGMTASGFDSAEAIIPQRASGYAQTPKGIRNSEFTDMTVPQGAGSLYSSTRDLLKWEKALFAGKVLKPASLATLTTPVRNNYAMGLVVEQTPKGRQIWHNGGIDGFNTYMSWDETNRQAVIVLGNLMSMAPDRMGRKLAAVARGEMVVLPSEQKAAKVEAGVLDQLVGSYALGPGFDIAIARAGDALTATGSGQPTIPLTAQSDSQFYAPSIDATLAFVRDASGKVTGFRLVQNGREMAANRK